MLRRILLLFVSGLIVSGCSLLAGEELTPTPAETIVIPTPNPSPTRGSASETASVESQPPPDTLIVWLAPGITNNLEAPGGRILSEQIQAFSANHPDIQMEISLKQPTGPGGTLSYLRTGRTVAPSMLPDLIVLPGDQLKAAAAEELIFPLTDLLSQESMDDLFSAARSISRVEDVTYAYPAALTGLDHMVYNSATITNTIPMRWEEMIALDNASLAIPGAGTPGGKLALQFYYASGGRLSEEGDLTSLDSGILTNSLSQISRARLEGMIPAESIGLTTIGEAWTYFTSGSTTSTITEAQQYLSVVDSEQDFNFAQIPGIERPLTPLLKGWVWAISTPDPTRQDLAAELLNWLIAGPNMGEWTLAAKLLPVRRSAFEQWPAENDYIQFLIGELERANTLPATVDNRVLTSLSTAVYDILSLAQTPQAAASEVIADLQS